MQAMSGLSQEMCLVTQGLIPKLAQIRGDTRGINIGNRLRLVLNVGSQFLGVLFTFHVYIFNMPLTITSVRGFIITLVTRITDAFVFVSNMAFKI